MSRNLVFSSGIKPTVLLDEVHFFAHSMLYSEILVSYKYCKYGRLNQIAHVLFRCILSYKSTLKTI